MHRVLGLFGVRAGIAVASYWTTKQPHYLDEKYPSSPSSPSSLSPISSPYSPQQYSPSLQHVTHSHSLLEPTRDHAFHPSPFTGGEPPLYNPDIYRQYKGYKGAIMASLPHLVTLQQLWGSPGISISVMVKGELVWSQALGYADIENAVPLSSQSRMRVASISKAFTSAALGILYETGKLDLDAPIQQYLPHFPVHQHPHPITARRLASHLSGIRHYLPDASDFYNTTNFASVHDAVEAIKDSALVAPTGSKFIYSTYGYTVLSAVMEKASGQNYLTLMQEKVFEPLGMLHTCQDEHNKVVPHRARHYKHNAPLQNSPYPLSFLQCMNLSDPQRYVDVSNKWAGGGFLSTTEDIARFGSAMLSGVLLKPETLRMLFTPQQTVDGTVTKYGLGWELRDLKHLYNLPERVDNTGLPQGWAVFHTGGGVGASSVSFRLPISFIISRLMRKDTPHATYLVSGRCYPYERAWS